ncbi:hypothetical protein [Bermanella sp. R86510]|uniref:hypothetical protein n=1 Tax=unclassified Bermanella TaxID=2627862 RepID=UPI0037CA31B6
MKFNERDIKVAIGSAIVACVVSVIALDMHGYIKHGNDADENIINTFELRVLNPKDGTKVSSKAANREAFCADGFLLMRPIKNQSGNEVAGILVDRKQRPIPCSRDLPAPGA